MNPRRQTWISEIAASAFASAARTAFATAVLNACSASRS